MLICGHELRLLRCSLVGVGLGLIQRHQEIVFCCMSVVAMAVLHNVTPQWFREEEKSVAYCYEKSI